MRVLYSSMLPSHDQQRNRHRLQHQSEKQNRDLVRRRTALKVGEEERRQDEYLHNARQELAHREGGLRLLLSAANFGENLPRERFQMADGRRQLDVRRRRLCRRCGSG